MKFIATLFFVSILVRGSLWAQNRDFPKNIQSPNAASLGKYGDVPVSYFTGSPNISIPLHSLSNNGIGLNMSLNYDASGILIDQHPGWVGQNWNVNVGGVITRSIVGTCDEYLNTTGADAEFPLIGYFYNFDKLTDENTSNKELLEALAFKVKRESMDLEPDIFLFNFMGKSGKFYMDNDGEWKVNSDDNLMVIMNDTLISPLFAKFPPPQDINYSRPKVIKGFKLIDGEGTTYIFGSDTNAIEYSLDFYRQRSCTISLPDDWKANSWYLTNVIDKFGNAIFEFTYERGSFVAQFFRNYYTKSYDFDGTNCFLCMGYPGCAGSIPMNTFDIEGNLISPVYLKQIKLLWNNNSNDVIQFEYSNSTELKYDSTLLQPKYDYMAIACYNFGTGTPYPLYYLQEANQYISPPYGSAYLYKLQWKKLDAIAIYGQLTKKILFRYNNILSERLNLLGIDVISGDWPYNPSGYQKYSYDFQYNQFSSLPGYLSKKEDHWGYYKGSAYWVNSDYAGFYDRRETVASYDTIGMLSRIIYPTGGYTHFNFEPHDYSQRVSDDRTSLISETGIAGGVRIKKITDFDGSNYKIRNYKYVTDYPANNSSTNSSGILTCKPKYFWPDWRCDGPDGSEYSLSVFSNASIVPLSNSFGTHIGYSEVVENRNDNSYTQYKYSNFDSPPLIYKDSAPLLSFNSTISPYTKFIDKSLMRGKMLNMTLYNSANSMVQENIYTYRTDQSMYSNYILATNTVFTFFCEDNNLSQEGYNKGTSYKVYYFDYDQIQIETKDYLTGGVVSKKTIYTKEDKSLTNPSGFSNLRLLKSSTSPLSDRNILTNYYYPTDLITEPNVQTLVNSFRIDEPIKTVLTSTSGGSSTLCIGVNKTTYKISNTKIVKDKELYSKSDEANLELVMSYDVYDNTGMLQQYTSSSGIPVVLLWDKSKNYVTARVENATTTQVGQPAGGDSKTLWSNLNILVPNAIFTTYDYSSFVGMTSQTAPNGTTTYFEYDLFGRLKAMKDQDGKILKQHEYHYKGQ